MDYEYIKGTKPSLPSSTITLVSASPTTVKWGDSSDVKFSIVVTTQDDKIPSSDLQLKVKSHLGYTSSLYFSATSNPVGRTQFKWNSIGNNQFQTSELSIEDALILNSSGYPEIGSFPRSASIEIYERVVISTITYYTTIKGTNPHYVTLRN